MPRTLLLADDSLTIRRLVELTFADEGIQVVAVADGQRAIEWIAASRPDIVLADAGMAPPDGYDVAEFVKGSPALANIPVILLTAAFQPIDEARAASVGCDAVLAKPFELTQLVSRVKELLEGALSAVPVARPAQDGPASREHEPAARLPEIPADAADDVKVPSTPQPEVTSPGDRRPSLDERIDRVDEDFADGEAPPPWPPASVGAPQAAAEEVGGESWSAEADGGALSLDDFFDQVEAAVRGEAAASIGTVAPPGAGMRLSPGTGGAGEGLDAGAGASECDSQGGAQLEQPGGEAVEELPADPVARVFAALLRASGGTPNDQDFERLIRALRGEQR